MKYLILLLPFLLLQNLSAQLSDFGSPDFSKADSIAARYEGEGLENLPLLAHYLTSPLDTELEKFRAIYTWVCLNIENDYAAFGRNKKMREKYRANEEELAKWDAEFRVGVFRKLLKKKQTVCTGFAYLLKELALMSDINCKIINGYGRTVEANVGEASQPNHSWNAVQLEGRWYLCDPTWSSGYTLLPAYTYVKEYCEGYFLAEPALFARNHYPLDKQWLLMEESPDFQDFLEAPLIYKYSFQHQLIPLKPEKMQVSLLKEEKLTFVLKAPPTTNTEDIQLEISSAPNKYDSVIPEIKWIGKDLLELSYDYRRRVNHDVHIKFGEEYIATYVVRRRHKK
ncbi:MAG: transglutaminase domain-containing protein [Bacteroidota bacterium]